MAVSVTGPFRALARLTIGILFCAAAIGKAAAPIRFGAVVNYVLVGTRLGDIPPMPIAFALILLECVLGLLYVLCLDGRVTHWITIGLVGSFSLILIWMWAYPPLHGCGCLGLFADAKKPQVEVELGMMRNIGIILAVLSLRTKQSIVSPLTAAQESSSRLSRSARSAFTLVEVLVAIVIVSILLAILLPSLGPAREEGKRIADMSQSRQVYVALVGYGTDAKDRFPYLATPGDLHGPISLDGVKLNVSYFTGQSNLYVNLLRGYYSQVASLTENTPDVPAKFGWPEGTIYSSVPLCYGAFSAPGYWVGSSAPPDGSLLQAGRWADLRVPAEKGLLLDLRADARDRRKNGGAKGPLPWLIVWGDGSAKMRAVDVTIAYRTVERPTAMFDWPVFATEEGLGGRDFVPRIEP